jgi:hypothetical protein
MDNYLESMRRCSAEMGRMSGQPGWEYAEGWRQHSHVGFSAEDRDVLSEALGDKAVLTQPHPSRLR